MARGLSQLRADLYNKSMVAARRRGAVWSLTDLGELAVRLGSPVWYDRRGDVIFIETFEHGVGMWDPSLSGAGATAALKVGEALSGGYSCRLRPGTTADWRAGIQRGFPFYGLRVMGYQVAFQNNLDISEFLLTVDQFDGRQNIYAACRYVVADNSLQYYSAEEEWVVAVSNLALSVGVGEFHVLKVVTDLYTEEYVRLMCDDYEVDLSGVGCRVTEASEAPLLQVSIYVTGLEGEAEDILVDDVVITQNEPTG